MGSIQAVPRGRAALMARPGEPRQLLARVLDQPELVSLVQSLEPRILGGLIGKIGLEDAGELVALATTAQIERIFDEDLWRSARPGKDEVFDAERFTLWLEVMMEAGAAFAAQKLSELDEDLVTLALCQRVLVIDLDALASSMSQADRSDEDDLIDKALESALNLELEEFRLVARAPEGWDTLVAVLLELDRSHHAHLRRLLERCSAIASEHIEDNGGLYQVLTSGETLETDVAADREDRREQQGFVAPSSAASFLALAHTTPLAALVAADRPDPITRAYFAAYGPGREDEAGGKRRAERERGSAAAAGRELAPVAARIELMAILEDAEVLPRGAPPLLEAAPGAGTRAPTLFQRAVQTRRGRDVSLYDRRLQEVSYLANVLIAGCALDGRAFRPLEATEASIATCSLGLDHLLASLPTSQRETQAVAALAHHDAVKLFRIGWHLLHQEVPPQDAPHEALRRFTQGD
jgi:hypothetical protein